MSQRSPDSSARLLGLPYCTWEWDLPSDRLRVKRCALSQFCQHEMAECQGSVRGAWMSLLSETDADDIKARILDQLKTQDDFHIRLHYHQNDGSVLLILHGIVADRDERDQPSRVIGLSRREASIENPDAAQAELVSSALEEKRRLEMILMSAQRFADISQIAGSVAHDLNNLLSPIRLSVELLRRKMTDDSLDRYVEIIEHSTSRARSVVQQLLSFAREAEKTSNERLDVNEVLRELEKMVVTTFPETIQANFNFGVDLPQPRMSAGQLHQALLNVLINARDAMDSRGRLRVRSSVREVKMKVTVGGRTLVPGTYVCISVSDDGCGMTPEIQERIFDPFFTTKSSDRGTGLGLPSVYGIIASVGGFIDLESIPDQGTTFHICLPALAD